MSAPPIVTEADTSIAAAARTMHREGIKRLPVVDEHGRLIGIVTRGDLLKVHLRPDDDIVADIRTGVLAGRAEAVTVAVEDGAVTLTGEVDLRSTADQVARLARQVPGVVEVIDKVGFAVDDSAGYPPGIAFGVA